MQTIIFYGAASAVFALCVFLFVFRHICAYRFKHKIADKYGFSEGIMTGAAYPLMIIFLALISVQFISLFILQPSSELEYCLRTLLYALSLVGFAIAYQKTPPLLAYWIGKTALWDKYGANKKIPFTDIYCATLSRKNDNLPTNSLRLCKFSFYAKNRTVHGIPKKFVCKLTALELTHISEQVPIYHHADAKTVKKEQLDKSILLRTLQVAKCLCLLSLCFLLMSSGIFFTPRYAPDEYDKTQEISTVTEITDVLAQKNGVVVYYGKINAISVYDHGGTHRFSLTLPQGNFKKTYIQINQNFIDCRIGNKWYSYDIMSGAQGSSIIPSVSYTGEPSPFEYCTDGINVHRTGESGEREAFLARAPYLHTFKAIYSWALLMLSLAAIFVIKFVLSDRTPPEARERKPKKEKAPKKPKKSAKGKPSKPSETETNVIDFDIETPES